MIGLTSITFRQMAPREIIDLAVSAGLEGIEWGSDVHVPPGDVHLAKEVAAMCAEAGLTITSYGSYFKAGHAEDPTEEIEALIASAKALGASVIRVWAGETRPQDVGAADRNRVENALRTFVDRAAEEGICVATEYHRHTLTENADSALQLLETVPGLRTYWQPNPDISEEQNLEELEKVLPYVMNVHVFQWTAPGNTRHPLAEGTAFWTRCMEKIRTGSASEHNFLLEFVLGDRPEQCIEDARVLRNMVRGGSMRKAIWMSERGQDLLQKVYTEEDRTLLESELEFVATVTDRSQLEALDLKDVQYIFSTWGMLALTREEIQAYLPSLKAVFYGAGSVQAFARPFLEEGVRVFSAATANAVPVAEYTVAQIILACKGFYQAARLYKEHRHSEAREFSESQPGFYDVNVGLIGAGQIGRLVIRMLKNYRVQIKVYDPFLTEAQAETLGVAKVSLEDLFSTCTIISNHVANNPQTVGMLNGKLFDRMQPFATFINTGRGAQIVEQDLAEALKKEPGRTAVLDVTLPEPVEDGHPFYDLPNVVLTPHIAGSMQQERARMGHYQMLEFFRVLRGEPPMLEVTIEMLKTMA